MVAEKDHFVAAPSLERFAALGPGSEAEFLVHYEFRHKLLFRNGGRDGGIIWIL